MRIRLNGEVREFEQGMNVQALLGTLSLNPRAVVVELNRAVIKADAFDTVLKAEDEVEVVQFVGGGAIV